MFHIGCSRFWCLGVLVCGTVACAQPKPEPQPEPQPQPTQKLSQKPKSVWVFREDGSVQCGGAGAKEKRHQALGDGKAALVKLGVKVLDMKKGTSTTMYPQMCGAPTGRVNMYKILENHKSLVETAGYKPL